MAKETETSNTAENKESIDAGTDTSSQTEESTDNASDTVASSETSNTAENKESIDTGTDTSSQTEESADNASDTVASSETKVEEKDAKKVTSKGLTKEEKALMAQLGVDKLYKNSKGEYFTRPDLANMSDKKENIQILEK